MSSPKRPAEKSRKIISGDLVDQNLEFTAEELCHSCKLQLDHVIELVQEGVLDASGENQAEWRFKVSSIRRVKTAVRLQRDLGVNAAGAALALELLDRIARLESRLR